MRVSLFPRQTPAVPTEVPAGVSAPTALPTDLAGISSAIPTAIKLPTGTGTSAAAATGTSTPGGVMSAVGGVKDTFTSWDKCMSKAYCKWPVIAVIIVGSLILLSVLFCIGRCLCCGAECACCCFRCCAGCCGGGRNKKHKHLDSVPPTPYPGGMPSQAWNQQYQSPPQPAYHSPLAAAPAPTPFQSASAAVPQFATFEVSSKKVHEDSLPAMPSWEAAVSTKVEVWEEPEAHELEKLNPNGQSTVTTFNSVASPQPVRPGPGPPSPYSEHDAFLAGGNHQYGASQYSLTGGQTAGFRRGDGYSSPAPNQHGGYAQHNVSQPSFEQQYGSQQNIGQSPYGQTHRGYAQQQQPYGGSQQNFGGQNDPYRSPVSPVYSGSTAYEPQRQQDHSPPYGGRGGYGQQGRKPVNGSWKDV